MTASADYARVVEQLSKARLTPYVAYVSSDTINGMGSSQTRSQIVVRVSDGTIVAGKSHFKFDTGDDSRIANPITAPIFDPACYRATSESPATFDGAPAVKLDLVPVCSERHHDNDYAFTTLYVQPGTLRPIDANGVVPTGTASKDVAVSMDQRFGVFDGRVMPTLMKVDVTGSSWMFWLQVHVRETYSDYRFLTSP